MHFFDYLVHGEQPKVFSLANDTSLKDVLNDTRDVSNSVLEIVSHLVKVSEDLGVDARIWRVESQLDLFRSLDLQQSSNQLHKAVLHLQNAVSDLFLDNGQKIAYGRLVNDHVEFVTKSFEEIFRKFFLIINVNKKSSYLLS